MLPAKPFRTFSVLLAALCASAALAADPAATPLGRTRADAEERSRAEVNDLLRTLCPEQCVLVSVEARVEDEAVGGAVPGFESLSGGAKLPTVRSVNASVLVDSQLPAPFRTRLKGLVAQRLKEVAGQSNVNVEALAFPPRNAPHLEAQPPAPTPPQPAAAAPSAPDAPVPTMGERLQESLLPAAPLLAVVLLLALSLMVLGGLLVLALRRPADGSGGGAWLEPEPLPEAAPANAQAAPALDYPAARARRLERTLREERAVRNAVVREALTRGELRPVALWTRELGDFLLEDLRGDADLGPAVAGVAAELGRVPALDAAARAQALSELEGRTLAARLVQAADSADAAFSFLQGVPPQRFASAVRALPSAALEVALRFAPAAARTAALQELSDAQRTALALALARQPEVSTAHALAVAEELRSRLAESAGGASQVDAMLGELLETLPLEEQDRLVEQLRREGDTRATRSLITESTLTRSPVEQLSAALLRLPPARLVSYLGGAEVSVREQLLAACPTKLQRELREELKLRGSSARDEFLAARRELLVSLREELARKAV
ncbi:hypothetical protein FGE12_06745 [Aggregicoccus sp. 17bor-14]|uniref:hypothetical protein n=1 Tax=Myxococcaceae TaxID=31 RepID=UPI00129D0AE7|nr:MULTISPECIES: hypothetical protein [Myxococcaceae]MBF5042086.1 hypothetical protein [Simulacricoccus sp. 17bor-14]MRI87865.1 hypothetical protein [Aggregicoccus sp. 17bor-14]